VAEPRTVQMALDRLWANFHIRPSEDSEALEAAEWLSALRGFSDAAVASATSEWIRNEDRFPTLSRFIAAVQDMARRQNMPLSLPSRGVTAGDEPVSPTRALEWIAAIRKTWADSPPSHNHTSGIAACPRCAYVDNHLDANAGYDPKTMGPTSPCRLCSGNGLVITDDGTRPCENCNPTGYGRWTGGHWDADHDWSRCPDCVALRSGHRSSG
jgi:hypothetical protein